MFAMQPDYNKRDSHFLGLHPTPSLWGNAVQKLIVNFVFCSGKITCTLEKEDRALMIFDTDWSFRRIEKFYISYFLERSSLSQHMVPCLTASLLWHLYSFILNKKVYYCLRTPLIKPVFHGLCTVFVCYYAGPNILYTFIHHLKIERLSFMQCCQMLHGNDEAQLQHRNTCKKQWDST